MKCQKRKYRSDIDAKIALAKLQCEDKEGHNEVRAYRCPDCGRWHLTKKKIRGGRNRK